MDVCSTSSYVSDWRRLDPQVRTLVRNYDDKNTCIEPNHEYATNFQIVSINYDTRSILMHWLILLTYFGIHVRVLETVFKMLPYFTSAKFMLFIRPCIFSLNYTYTLGFWL